MVKNAIALRARVKSGRHIEIEIRTNVANLIKVQKGRKLCKNNIRCANKNRSWTHNWKSKFENNTNNSSAISSTSAQ